MSTTSPMPWTAPSPLPARFETARLVLRMFDRGDEQALFEAVSRHREALLPWLPWAKTEHRHVNDTIFMIERMRRAAAEPGACDFLIGMFEKQTEAVMGATGFHRMRVDAHEAEIGYWVRGDLHGRGICTEAVRGLISWGFTPQNPGGDAPASRPGGWGLRRLHIRCADANVASARVPAKLGLRQEVNIKDERWLEGVGYVGALGWGVLADEWDIEARRRRGTGVAG